MGKNAERIDKQVGKIRHLQQVDIPAAQKELNQLVLNQSVELFKTVASSIESIYTAQISQIDRLIQRQQDRIVAAGQLNTELSNELIQKAIEQQDKLEAAREQAVRKQVLLNQIAIVSDAVAAIVAQAKFPSPANVIAITSTIAAMTAGIIAAKQAVRTSFYKGGYTGDGNPKENSTALGVKSYNYEKGEFVFDHIKTRENKNEFQKIHEGKINLKRELLKAQLFDKLDLPHIKKVDLKTNNISMERVEREIISLKEAVQKQSRLKVSIDRHGISAISSEFITKDKKLKKLAS